MGCHSPSTVACATEVITPPATTRYPATVTIPIGSVTGDAIIAPPTAARHNPTFRIIRKNLDVGAVNRWTNDKFLVAILHIFKDECFNMRKPLFKEFDFLIH